jgi:hypothetical protein
MRLNLAMVESVVRPLVSLHRDLSVLATLAVPKFRILDHRAGYQANGESLLSP